VLAALLLVEPLFKRVDQVIDRRQAVTVAELVAADGDVALGVAEQLDAGAAAQIELGKTPTAKSPCRAPARGY
jgi:hypothetical protein